MKEDHIKQPIHINNTLEIQHIPVNEKKTTIVRNYTGHPQDKKAFATFNQQTSQSTKTRDIANSIYDLTQKTYGTVAMSKILAKAE